MQKYRVLAVLGIIALGIFSFIYIYKNMGNRWGKSYSVKVEVTDTGSLAIGTSVFMNGVKIGSVRDVYLGQNSVVVDLEIDGSVKIPIGSQVKITPVGMIGNLKVSIFRPKEFEGYLKNGDLILGTGPISTNLILERATEVVESVNGVLSDLRLKELGDNVNEIIKQYNESGNANLIKAIENINIATNELRDLLESEHLDNSLRNFENITKSVASMLKLSLEARVEWNLLAEKDIDSEIIISLMDLYVSKRNFYSWKEGYSFYFKKSINFLNLYAGMMYDSFGVIASCNLGKNAKIGVKATNIPDTHYKLFFDMIMGDILFGPIYSLTENVFMFNMGYSVSL